MKLSKQTLNVLSNFATINNGMVFYEGNEQRVITANKMVLADVTLAESFPKEFAIYDLNQFLAVISLFDDPDIEFEDTKLTIKENGREVSYRYSEKTLVVSIPKDKKIELASVDIQLELDANLLSQVLKSAKVFGVENIAVVGDSETIHVRTLNPKEEDSSFASFTAGQTDKKFKMVININNLKMLPGNYTLKISKKGIAKLISKDLNLVYTFTCETTSKFEG